MTKLQTTATDIFLFTGGSDDIRAALYSSVVSVLRESPIFGVGYGQIMQAGRQLYPPQEQVFVLDNLHADWANFAVIAAGNGPRRLAAAALCSSSASLLSAPLLLLRSRAALPDRSIVLGALLLTTGQATLGVSNAMFGILPQSRVFPVSLGYLLARVRQLEATAEAHQHTGPAQHALRSSH